MTGIEVVIGNCFPIYMTLLWRCGTSNILGSQPWPFGVTWRHRLRDHSTHGGWLPMGGP